MAMGMRISLNICVDTARKTGFRRECACERDLTSSTRCQFSGPQRALEFLTDWPDLNLCARPAVR